MEALEDCEEDVGIAEAGASALRRFVSVIMVAGKSLAVGDH
jgi:hypothetical protein